MAPSSSTPPSKGITPPEDTVKPWLYDSVLWLLSILVDLFFREVHPRSSWKIPKSGPVIFVAAPHANQFIDPLILARLIRSESRRRVAFLIAEKSLHRKAIGTFSRAMGAVGVGRALDATRSVKGKVFLPDPDGDPTLLRGVGTNFESVDFQIGGLVVLPSVNAVAANAEIAQILGPTELRVKSSFKGEVAWKQLTGRESRTNGNTDQVGEKGVVANGHASGSVSNAETTTSANDSGIYEGTPFKVAPKIDQTKVYDQVFARLSKGDCVGIFPEGGSHDRTELLPLKAGVAIMALGAMAANPDCGLKIVPCGMNYFHAHKFRSRAVVEFGTPLEVPKELVAEYKNGSRREAVGHMLELVYNALVAVTVTSPDFDTLMLIQAVRRLYNPKNKPLPLSVVVELNRRLVKGYTQYKDDPRIVSLKQHVMDYHRRLLALNVRDHQLQYARFSVPQVTGMLLYRVLKLAVLSAAVLPGLVLFAPIFVAGKVISIRKAREALAASTVKIQARDVVATWKILVAMGLAPALYTSYSVLLTVWALKSRMHGTMPSWLPTWTVFVLCYGFSIAISFAALRFGEVGMDIAKSLRPLVLALNPTASNSLVKLRIQRQELAAEVTDVINELGPELFPDFEKMRLIHTDGPVYNLKSTSAGPTSPQTPTSRFQRSDWREQSYAARSGDLSPSETANPVAGIGGGLAFASHIPRNESFRNLSSVGMFSSHPQTPTSPRSQAGSRSSSRSRGRGLSSLFGGLGQGFSSLDEHGALDDIAQRIRGAMQERGVMRRRGEQIEAPGDDEDASDAESIVGSGATTPGGGEAVVEMKKSV